jgi:aspartyl-tRNA(Asn)/glutamyl-tRNA(Gln) amidotransferase subunit B
LKNSLILETVAAGKKYEPVIGLEVHAQLLTESKAFCSCSTEFGREPNSNVCPVCLGMPGVLPVLNKKLVEFVVMMGLATHCTIAPRSVFARKNYFYPDLPKGYQISQYEEPICRDGFVEIELPDGSKKKIGITRIHMEEDAGKSIHDRDAETLIDINRCGVPLMEIVSEPDIRSAREAYLYLSKIRQIVTYLNICDGNMEEGSLRCDANISIRLKGAEALGTKTEVKNMNSFRYLEKALTYEIDRQIDILESGDEVVQETLLWDEKKGMVHAMRSKEEAHDYRYFPDPDLVSVVMDQVWIQNIRELLSELPDEKRNRFIDEYGLPQYDADVLTVSRDLADYFESALQSLQNKNQKSIKNVSNWVMGDVLRVVHDRPEGIYAFPIPSSHIGELVNLIENGTISGKIAKDVFEYMLTEQKSPEDVVRDKGLRQVSDTKEIGRIVREILDTHPAQVSEYRAGKTKMLGFFVGQVMKKTKGKANPEIVNELIEKLLDGE